MSARPLPFLHPACLLATWFGSGLLPRAPGTWGSLAALPCAVPIVWAGGPWALFAAALLLYLPGVWAARHYAAGAGRQDPGEIVIDEVVGQWLALVPVAFDLPMYAVAFLAFRVFDIVKVWPANWVDRRLPGGWGIMTDDVVAGVYAAAATYGLAFVMR